jgi:hypothetical protein
MLTADASDLAKVYDPLLSLIPVIYDTSENAASPKVLVTVETA